MKQKQLTVGMILVHGVGRQEPSDLLWKFQSAMLPEIGSKKFARATSSLQLADRMVHLYEVYWGDILTGRPVVGSFDYMDPPKLSWFPLLNFLSNGYKNLHFPLWLVILRTVTLIPAGLALAVIYWGAGLFATMAKERDGFLKLHEMLDEYAGDVVNYTNSLGGARQDTPLASCSKDILDRFDNEMVSALEDGCDEIYILAHSLGSVIMYHGLTGANTNTDAVARVKAVFTIGSPLEKIGFFWPQLVSFDTPSQSIQQPVEWYNFYGWPDSVSGRLGRFKSTVTWATLKSIPLRGLGGLASAHTYYLNHPRVQEIVNRYLLDKPYARKLNTCQRITQFLRSFGENLLVPVVLLMLIAGGFYVLAIPGALLALTVIAVYVLLGGGDWSMLVLADSIWWSFVPMTLICLFSFRAASREHKKFWRRDVSHS